MDKMGANFKASAESLHKLLGANAHAIQLNIGEENHFVGIIDLVEMKAYSYDSLYSQINELLGMAGK